MNRAVSISQLVGALLAWAVLVPFVPVLVPSSDTQPTFLILVAFAVLIGFAFPLVGRNLFRISLPGLVVGTLAALALYACLVSANALQQDSTIPSRLVSFLQFSAAALWGYAGKFEWSEKTLFRAVVIYAGFTVIYFATGGVIENTIIHSRIENAQTLFAMGRGARTLSPEPSFFALQIFNIFVLARIVSHTRETDMVARGDLRWSLVGGFCLMASLSAYGALLLLLMILAFYPRVLLIAVVAAFMMWNLLSGYLATWDSVRAVKVILTFVQSKGSIAQLILLDASLSSRTASFGTYVRSFAAHPWIGNGFSLYEGGGFISVVSAFGIVAVFFFALLLYRIARGGFDIRIKVILFVWFVLNFLSGPIGVPIIGVIVGRLFAARKAQLPSSERAETAGSVDLAIAR